MSVTSSIITLVQLQLIVTLHIHILLDILFSPAGPLSGTREGVSCCLLFTYIEGNPLWAVHESWASPVLVAPLSLLFTNIGLHASSEWFEPARIRNSLPDPEILLRIRIGGGRRGCDYSRRWQVLVRTKTSTTPCILERTDFEHQRHHRSLSDITISNVIRNIILQKS